MSKGGLKEVWAERLDYRSMGLNPMAWCLVRGALRLAREIPRNQLSNGRAFGARGLESRGSEDWCSEPREPRRTRHSSCRWSTEGRQLDSAPGTSFPCVSTRLRSQIAARLCISGLNIFLRIVAATTPALCALGAGSKQRTPSRPIENDALPIPSRLDAKGWR